jgi:hypothetical protein
MLEVNRRRSRLHSGEATCQRAFFHVKRPAAIPLLSAVRSHEIEADGSGLARVRRSRRKPAWIRRQASCRWGSHDRLGPGQKGWPSSYRRRCQGKPASCGRCTRRLRCRPRSATARADCHPGAGRSTLSLCSRSDPDRVSGPSMSRTACEPLALREHEPVTKTARTSVKSRSKQDGRACQNRRGPVTKWHKVAQLAAFCRTFIPGDWGLARFGVS